MTRFWWSAATDGFTLTGKGAPALSGLAGPLCLPGRRSKKGRARSVQQRRAGFVRHAKRTGRSPEHVPRTVEPQRHAFADQDVPVGPVAARVATHLAGGVERDPACAHGFE